MKIKSLFAVVSLLTFSGAAFADLEPFKDFNVSDAVWSVTTVRVDSNMGNAYLEGLKKTWVPSTEIQKKLGHIESWAIYRSDLPASGDFNLMLVVKFANTAAMGPNKKRYDAFMKEFGDSRSKESDEFAQKNYPGMRTITGEYNLREVTFK